MIPGAFKFRNVHSTSFKIISRSVNRPILPMKRQNKIVVPGRHGTYDFGDNTYEDRSITMEIAYIGKDYNELRLRGREIAAWLSSKHYQQLIFDDELNKFYLAKLHSTVDLENFYRLGRTQAIFDCKPFAYSIDLKTVENAIVLKPHNVVINTAGTVETPPILTLENQGTNTLTNIALSIEFEIE
ncbi:phage tail component [Clostridium aceticum]|uniref:Phage tail component n=1 Tax=Clostridium aceticum TaxID=84022 RepID=A0A0D8IA24_9CLOT|nr:distal tail protein Dit [Clostridium aceticum]AKL96618.1 phage tail component [Clostridium aceticum]KJF26076.1 hypothetical protein TZ02_15260 [Clostridium aceticum]